MKLLLSFSLLFISLSIFGSIQDYYSRSVQDQLRSGNLYDKELVKFIKTATNKHFHGLGYKKDTKKFLFGVIDLQKDEKGYFLFDTYCHKIIRNVNGNNVGPKKVPKNVVMNAEHVWPQSLGARSEPARGDIHHLFPTDSKANSSRGNLPFSEVLGGSVYSDCSASKRGSAKDPQTSRSTHIKSFEPPDRLKGNIARAMFYVSARYRYEIPAVEEFYLRKWNKQDPVDQQEMRRNDAIEKAQGNRNPFVDFQTLDLRINNF